MGEPVYAPHIDEVNKAMYVSIAEVSRNNTPIRYLHSSCLHLHCNVWAWPYTIYNSSHNSIVYVYRTGLITALKTITLSSGTGLVVENIDSEQNCKENENTDSKGLLNRDSEPLSFFILCGGGRTIYLHNYKPLYL